MALPQPRSGIPYNQPLWPQKIRWVKWSRLTHTLGWSTSYTGCIASQWHRRERGRSHITHHSHHSHFWSESHLMAGALLDVGASLFGDRGQHLSMPNVHNLLVFTSLIRNLWSIKRKYVLSSYDSDCVSVFRLKRKAYSVNMYIYMGVSKNSGRYPPKSSICS